MKRVLYMGVVSLALAAATMPATAADDAGAMQGQVAFAQAEPGVPAEAGDEAQLKALTEQVLQSLGAATKPRPRRQEPQATPGNYESLMKALSTLVEQATRQGKSSEDVLALIEEALANEDEERLNALIKQAGGRVGLRRLLQALVQKAAMKAAADDPYVRALQAEGQATRVTEATSPASGPGEGGMRTIRVEPGDTLGIIALRVYGSVRKWRDIYEANRDRLKNPDLVPAGITLRLP